MYLPGWRPWAVAWRREGQNDEPDPLVAPGQTGPARAPVDPRGVRDVDAEAARAGGTGQFSGSVVVLWLGDGPGSQGDGRFLFVPQPNDPLRFTRPGNPPAGRWSSRR